jgi:hypothetical protein
MIVFGGWNGTDFYNDVFVLDLQIMAWSKPETTGKFKPPNNSHFRPGTLPSQRSLRYFDWKQPGCARRILFQ